MRPPSSDEPLGGSSEKAWWVLSCSRMAARRILPLTVRGSSSTGSMMRGYLWGGRLALHPLLQLGGKLVASLPAVGKHHRRLHGEACTGSGTPVTATSRTAWCSSMTDSISKGGRCGSRSTGDVVVAAHVPVVALPRRAGRCRRCGTSRRAWPRSLLGTTVVLHHDAGRIGSMAMQISPVSPVSHSVPSSRRTFMTYIGTGFPMERRRVEFVGCPR